MTKIEALNKTHMQQHGQNRFCCCWIAGPFIEEGLIVVRSGHYYLTPKGEAVLVVLTKLNPPPVASKYDYNAKLDSMLKQIYSEST